jgi:hypothetical protein
MSDRQHYEDLITTFGTTGWRRIVEDAQAAIEDRKNAAIMAKSFEEVCYLRGEAEQLATLVNLEQVTRLMLDQLDEEDE